MLKTIFHIDFDSYFCSAHRSINPALKNKPIAIGRKLKRSIVASISYELKDKGVKVGWPKYKVLEIEPKTIFVEPNFNLYVSLSEKIFDYISKNYTKNIEVYSIDECWIDATEICLNKDPILVAKKLQNDILKKYEIPLSVGISHTKFLAKLSTNMAKPFGVLYTRQEDVKSRIWPLDILKYFGIGAPSENKLRKLNINTIKDLALSNASNINLYHIFGIKTQKMIDEANGCGDDQLNYEHNDLKNIGNELTFLSYDLDERSDILDVIKQLVNKVCWRAHNRNVFAQVISLSLRHTNKTWVSHQQTLEEATNDPKIILNYILKIFNKMWKDEMLRGVGVRLHKLVNEFSLGKKINLFEVNQEEKVDDVNHLIKNINYKFKKKVLKTLDEHQRNRVKENIQKRYLQEDLAKKG